MAFENMRKFLRNMSDQRVMDLQAHCEDGKFRFSSCDCFIGAATNDHALGQGKTAFQGIELEPHYALAKTLPYAVAAEDEAMQIGDNTDRGEVIAMLCREEMLRRQINAAPNGNIEMLRINSHSGDTEVLLDLVKSS